MIRILHEVGNLDGGGVARLLYDYYCHMDREKIHFDFIIYDFYKEGILEEPLRQLGSIIYKLPSLQKNKEKCISEMKHIMSEGQYDIVHSHRGPQAFYFLYVAKRCGIKRRIVHSHLAYSNPSIFRRFKNRILLKADKWIATDLFACGREAGIAMWGKHDMMKNKVFIMTNAIDTERFKYSEDKRQQKRKELGLTSELTIGIVGRLEEQKNYPFLLDIFEMVMNKKADAVLIIVGRGSLDEQVRLLAAEKGIEKNVMFLGVRSDVRELLNAFDVFVLPSFYEGLPVVLVEAQANGLPEVVSNAITDEMAVTDLITFLPLGNADEWSEKILNAKRKASELYSDIVGANGYGIEQQAKRLQSKYLVM